MFQIDDKSVSIATHANAFQAVGVYKVILSKSLDEMIKIYLNAQSMDSPSQIPTLVTNVANSMTDGWTCSPTTLP